MSKMLEPGDILVAPPLGDWPAGHVVVSRVFTVAKAVELHQPFDSRRIKACRVVALDVASKWQKVVAK